MDLQFKDSKNQFFETVGEYTIYKEEVIDEYSNGWSHSKRHKRILILRSDSCYKEINHSFETFGFIDEEGRWKIINNQLILHKTKKINFGSQSIDQQESDSNELNPAKKLEIISKNQLKILSPGFLNNEVMKKQLTNPREL